MGLYTCRRALHTRPRELLGASKRVPDKNLPHDEILVLRFLACLQLHRENDAKDNDECGNDAKPDDRSSTELTAALRG
eukprot:m.258523 g.258523  ORF g.258523 m.258523 type:complete len:78 (-) comp26621_c0_seq1:4378-4611(-)